MFIEVESANRLVANFYRSLFTKKKLPKFLSPWPGDGLRLGDGLCLMFLK